MSADARGNLTVDDQLSRELDEFQVGLRRVIRTCGATVWALPPRCDHCGSWTRELRCESCGAPVRPAPQMLEINIAPPDQTSFTAPRPANRIPSRQPERVEK